MANVITYETGTKQFQGIFKEMWTVNLTGIDFGDAATGSGTFASVDSTVPGVIKGDIVLFASISLDTIDTALIGSVTADNVVTMTILNNTGAAVNHAAATVKLVIGRPSW